MPRPVAPLPVPPGPAVLDVLPDLAAALTGAGPVLMPVPAGAPAPTVGSGSAVPAVTRDDADPVAFAVATSGSTGDPKLVLLPASAVRAAAENGQRRLLDAAGSRPGAAASWLLGVPSHTVGGLLVLVRAVLSGTEPVVLDSTGGFRVPAFIHAVDRLAPGPAFVSLVPTQLHRLLAGAEGDGAAALRRFDAVLLGGAAAPEPLLARAREAGVRVVVSYGMTETCGGCLYDGWPLDGVDVTVAGDGRVRVSGDQVAAGYLGLSGPPFSRDPRTGRRTVETGDLGARLPDGSVRILGRADDMLVSGGVNVAPQAVEAVLAELPGVAQVVVVGVPDAEWGQCVVAVVVASADGRPDAAAARRLVADRLGPAAAPRAMLLTDALPVTGPGKVDRAAAARLASERLTTAPR